MGPLRLLLDTCAWIWLVSEPARLGAEVARAIDDPSSEIHLSDSSVWELCLKWQAGKIQLPQPPSLWVEEQSRTWGVKALSIERRHLYRVSELPAHHRDPFDRLLIAQAIEERLILATPDANFRSYPVAVLW